MFVHVEFEAALRCLLEKCWAFTPLSGSRNRLYFCTACRLVWGPMIPPVGVLSNTVILILAHDRSALTLACIHLLISCTLRAVTRLLFCHSRLTFVPLTCVSAFKNTFQQQGSEQSLEILFVLMRVGWEMIRGFSVTDTSVFPSCWSCSEETILMVERSWEQQACLFFWLIQLHRYLCNF